MANVGLITAHGLLKTDHDKHRCRSTSRQSKGAHSTSRPEHFAYHYVEIEITSKQYNSVD